MHDVFVALYKNKKHKFDSLMKFYKWFEENVDSVGTFPTPHVEQKENYKIFTYFLD